MDVANPPVKEPLDRGTVMALVALALAVFVVANDFTALSVALPNMEADLDADVGTIQWVINAYALVFGVLIITGGRLADMFGRRRIFFAGAAIFAAFSAVAGAAPNAEILIAARALMAIGGAMMWPAVLGLTYHVLPPSRQGLAGPLVLGVAGAGNAFGPILGGFLTEALTWRWVLFLNLPIAALACAVTYAKVAADAPERDDGGLDYAGVTALSLGLVALLVALDQVTDWGWGDPRIIALLAACVVALAVFVAIERRAGPRALIPPDVGGNRTFALACVAIMLMAATFFALLLYAPQIMQKLMGFGALQSGIGFLPMMVTFSLMSFVAGPLYERYGGGRLIVAGAACMPVGMLAISFVEADSPYLAIVPGLLIAGLGVGLFLPTVTTVAVTALDPSRTSLAGGVIYMFQVAGGSVGLGLTTTIFTSATLSHVHASSVADRLDAAQEHAVTQILAGNETSQSLLRAFPDMADELRRVASEAFVAGVHTALRVDAALALAGFAIAVYLVARLRRASGGREPAPPSARGT